MNFTLDLLKFEIKNYSRNKLLFIINVFALVTIGQEAGRFIGKQGYLYSEMVKNGILTISQETIAMAVIFTLPTMLFATIFVFGSYYRMFFHDKYSEITLSKTIKTYKIVFYKVFVSFVGFIAVNLVITFLFTWYCLNEFKASFDPVYYLSLYIIYSVIPLFFWAAFTFMLVVLISDAKILYPILLLVWFINILPFKYTLLYKDWDKINLCNPLADSGLWANRIVYLLIAAALLVLSVKILELKRRDLFRPGILKNLFSMGETGQEVYDYKNSWVQRLLTSYKINLSWRFIFGVIIFAIIPPLLNHILPQIYKMISPEELLNKVLRAGEVYMALAVLLYSTYSLNVERHFAIGELICCKPYGLRMLYIDKLKVFFLFSVLMIASYFTGMRLFVSDINFFTVVKVLLPECMFYIVLVYALGMLIKRKEISLGICYVLWIINFFSGIKLPVLLSTFAPIQARNTEIYGINKIELVLVSIILLLLCFVFTSKKPLKEVS